MIPTRPRKTSSRSSDSSTARRLAAGERPVRDGQRAQREVGEPVDVGQDLAPALVGRAGAPRRPTRSAVQRASSTSGAPFVTTATPSSPSRVGLDGAHQLALGRERHSPTRWKRALARLVQARDLAPRRPGTRPRRIALDRPFPVLLAQDGVVRQAAGRQHRADLVEQRPGRRSVGRRRAARPRAVAAAGDVDLARAR